LSSTISPNELGKTLIHEHILFGFAGWYADESIAPFDRKACVESLLDTMKKLKTQGLSTFVDVTPNDCGRDPLLLKEISEKSGMHIVCATGLYTDLLGGSAYFKFRSLVANDVTTEIYELFVREIAQGIGETGIKAGV